MSTFDGGNYYYSGQGVVMVGDRASNGRPKGLIPVGNVSDLKLGLATTVVEHKESQTGNRAIDLRLITELKSSLQMTVENFSKEGLSSALAGTYATVLGSAVTAEASTIYFGRVSATERIKVRSVVVKRGTQTLVAYTDELTPYDYLLNTEAGSIKFNDGQILKLSAMCTGASLSPTAITVGYPTLIDFGTSVPDAIIDAGVGSRLAVDNFAGADLAVINARSWLITAINESTGVVSLAVDTTGKTITIGTATAVADGTAMTFDYSYADQNQIEAMTAITTEKYLRFEGLNTADGGNPVVVEVFRFLVDPLKELALISDTVGPFVLDGNTLSDSLRLTGSKFFKVTQLR